MQILVKKIRDELKNLKDVDIQMTKVKVDVENFQKSNVKNENDTEMENL